MRRIAWSSWAGIALLSACSKGPSTAAGPLGNVDLTSRLPAGVSPPPDATTHDATVSVCPGGKGDTPASVHVRWKTFANGGASYVSSYTVELDKQVAGLTIALDGDPKISNAKAPASGPPLTVVAITLKCTRNESRKLVFEEQGVVFVRADGVADVKK